jgi:hypothetical protein
VRACTSTRLPAPPRQRWRNVGLSAWPWTKQELQARAPSKSSKQRLEATVQGTAGRAAISITCRFPRPMMSGKAAGRPGGRCTGVPPTAARSRRRNIRGSNLLICCSITIAGNRGDHRPGGCFLAFSSLSAVNRLARTIRNPVHNRFPEHGERIHARNVDLPGILRVFLQRRERKRRRASADRGPSCREVAAMQLFSGCCRWDLPPRQSAVERRERKRRKGWFSVTLNRFPPSPITFKHVVASCPA